MVFRIGIVIRALNEADHLPKLLSGLRQQTVRPDQIVLVDSGSKDGTVEIAESLGCKVVPIDPALFTYGRSLNRGFEACDTEIVVVVSAHVYPTHDDYIENLTKPFSTPSVGMVYGRQVGDSTSQYSERLVLEGWFPGAGEAWQRHPFANNANSAVRKEVWNQYRFSETLPGLEDIHFAQRIQETGWFLAYRSDAEVVHVHNESWRGIKLRYAREASALRQIFPAMSFSRARAVILMLRNITRDFFQATASGVSWSDAKQILSFRYWQTMGFISGFYKQPEQVREIITRYFYAVGEPTATEIDEVTRKKLDYGAPPKISGDKAW